MTVDELCREIMARMKPAECDHSHRHTKNVLLEAGEQNIDDWIEFLKNNGGSCDCEVVWNVRAATLAKRPKADG